MIRKLFLIFFLYAVCSLGEELKLESIHLENVPGTYKEVFRDFFLKNFSIKEEISSKDKLKINISWTGLAYTVCLNFIFFNQKEKISCFTAQSGEEFYEKFYSLLKEYQINPPKIKRVNLLIKTNIPFKGKKLRVFSEKRDILVDYKSVKYTKGEPFIEGNINIDTLYIDDDEAAKLLKFLLEGNKIRQILIIK